MRLPELDTGEDAQLPELMTATIDRHQVTARVEERKPHMAGPVDILLRMLADIAIVDPPGILQVEMLGKHNDRQPDPVARSQMRTIEPNDTGSAPQSHDHSL